MYNEDFKNRFIQDISDSYSYRRLCKTIFDDTEKAENSWNADICTRSPEELEPVLNDILGLRKSGHISRLNVLRRYFKYCMDAGYPGAGDAIERVVISNVDKIRRETVSGPLGMQRYLNKYFEQESEQTMANVYRLYYWLAFAGMPEEEIFNVRVSDVDLSYGVIRHNGEEYPIYTEAYPAVRNAMELTRFLYKHPGYTKNTYKERINSDKLLRGIKTTTNVTEDSSAGRSLKSNIYRIFKLKSKQGTNGVMLSFSHAALSGLFYRKYELEDKQKQPYTYEDFLDAAADAMHDTHKDTVPESELRRKRKRTAISLLEDYEAWKCAFNL